MTLTLREPQTADAPALGEICYQAFKAVAEAHNYPPDMPSAEAATGLITGLIANEGIYGVAAESGGRLIGSAFLDERCPISGVGPVTVDPEAQNAGAGRAMMTAVMQRSKARGFVGSRLVQAGYHMRSLSLYLSLGFEAREHLSCLQGPAIGATIPGSAVRPATAADQAACDRLCLQVHGHDRGGELKDAIAAGSARVVERAGRITGYVSAMALFGHAAAETTDDLKALIGASEAFGGPGILVPTRNAELMRWCLASGLRIGQSMTLMSQGLYGEPQGAWMPSVIY
jgi:GNAT superfamily N-acetyltransferase